MANDDRQQTIDEFNDSVNMTRKELEGWLQTDESRSVGQGEGESKGHEPGRRIVKLLEKKQARLHRRRPRPHKEGQRLRQAPPRPGAEERPRGLEVALLPHQLFIRNAAGGLA